MPIELEHRPAGSQNKGLLTIITLEKISSTIDTAHMSDFYLRSYLPYFAVHTATVKPTPPGDPQK